MTRVIVAGKYQLLKKIGAGSFGKIFEARGVTPLQPPSGEGRTQEAEATEITGVEHKDQAHTASASCVRPPSNGGSGGGNPPRCKDYGH